MKIYNESQGHKDQHSRRASKCSYCRAEGHNATNCPRVAEDFAWFKQNPPVIPIGVSATTKTCHWYSNPKYWGEWYQKCKDAHAKQVAAKQKASNSRTGAARTASKCGFCGSLDHNRRNCEAMDDYTANAIKANRNWRRTFYNIFVEQMGISEGALLNLKTKGGYSHEDKDVIGIVTSVNWDQLSVFCASSKSHGQYDYREDAYRQFLEVTVQIDGESTKIKFSEAGIGVEEHGIAKNLVKYTGERYSWRNPEFISVLSPSKTPLGEEWIEEGHAKAVSFLTKKRSKAKLDEADITSLINQWV